MNHIIVMAAKITSGKQGRRFTLHSFRAAITVRSMKSKKHQKLRNALAVVAASAKARANDPMPDTAVMHRFNVWSDALRDLVRDSLQCVEGERMDEWLYDPDCDNSPTFAFHYNMTSFPLGYTRPMFLRMNLRFHADADLDTELRRLQLEVSEYRKCANRMYSRDLES